MKCASCGKDIHSVLVDEFDYYGSDSWHEREIEKVDEETGCVAIRTSQDWTGYGETRDYPEEAMGAVRCPFCKKYPFTEKEIDVDEPVFILAWTRVKEIGNDHQ